MRVIYRRFRPLLVEGINCIGYCKGNLCKLNLNTKKLTKIVTLPIKDTYKFFSSVRLFERLLRIEAKHAVRLSDNELLIVLRGAVYHVDETKGQIEMEHVFRSGMTAPINFIKIENVDGFDDCIAYGEYFGNNDRSKKVAIYVRSRTSNTWAKKYEFPEGTVRHIHALVPDSNNGCVYVLTGDLDQESGIWIAKNNFAEVIPFSKGKQSYRTTNLFVNGENLTYATDTALEQNYIYQLNISKSSIPRVITEIDGSCLNSISNDDYYYFSTAVEADERVRGWKSWLNYKRGPGIKSNESQVLRVDKNYLQVKKIVSFKKDFYLYKLFQYGHVLLMDCPAMSGILLYPIAVKKYDATLILIGYEEETEHGN